MLLGNVAWPLRRLLRRQGRLADHAVRSTSCVQFPALLVDRRHRGALGAATGSRSRLLVAPLSPVRHPHRARRDARAGRGPMSKRRDARLPRIADHAAAHLAERLCRSRSRTRSSSSPARSSRSRACPSSASGSPGTRRLGADARRRPHADLREPLGRARAWRGDRPHRRLGEPAWRLALRADLESRERLGERR